jgi:hypothetical protein
MDHQAYLLHQVHAAKLATDISAGLVSGWLMWHRRVPAALLAGFVPAAIASALVTRRDLSSLADTRRGRLRDGAYAASRSGAAAGWAGGRVAGRIQAPPGWHRRGPCAGSHRLVAWTARLGAAKAASFWMTSMGLQRSHGIPVAACGPRR